MDLKNTSTILKKINRLYELISDIGEASSTETDLLKAYVLDLYEAVTMSDIEEAKDLDDDEMNRHLKKQKKLEKKIKKTILKNTVAEQADDFDDDEEDYEAPASKNGTSQEGDTKAPEAAKPTIDASLLSLFDLEEGHDLSDKLGLSPIKDLTKAMGINEKIFTINELFGGHQEEFDNIMVALNGLNNFEEAKSVLIRSVAPKYNWQKDENLKKAKHFIRLVQRRYN